MEAAIGKPRTVSSNVEVLEPHCTTTMNLPFSMAAFEHLKVLFLLPFYYWLLSLSYFEVQIFIIKQSISKGSEYYWWKMRWNDVFSKKYCLNWTQDTFHNREQVKKVWPWTRKMSYLYECLIWIIELKIKETFFRGFTLARLFPSASNWNWRANYWATGKGCRISVITLLSLSMR